MQDRFEDGIGIDVKQRASGRNAITPGSGSFSGGEPGRNSGWCRERGRETPHAGATARAASIVWRPVPPAECPAGCREAARRRARSLRHGNRARLTRHMRSNAGKIQQPVTAIRTTAASTAFGRFSSNPVRKSRQSASVIEAKTSASGVRAPALSFTADCDSPPATG